MKNLKLNRIESLKDYQIEPVEKMSCIRGGASSKTGAGVHSNGHSYSSDAINYVDENGRLWYERYWYCGQAEDKNCENIQSMTQIITVNDTNK
jgi:hypothetical protein